MRSKNLFVRARAYYFGGLVETTVVRSGCGRLGAGGGIAPEEAERIHRVFLRAAEALT